MNMTIRLESVMHQYRGFGVISSPFRRCLNRYLAKYPIKTVRFFVQGSNSSHGVSTRLYIPNYISLWRSLLSDEQLRDPVLQYLRSDMDILIKSALAVKYQYAQNSVGVTKEQMVQIGQRNAIVLELHLQSLWTVQVLAKSQANWLCHQGSLVEYMTMMWRSPRRQKQLFGDKMLSLRVQEETRYLVEVLTLYTHECVLRNPDDVMKEKESSKSSKFVTQYVSVMFDLLVVFTKATLIDFSFLEDFYKNKLSSTSIAPFHKFEIIRYFIALFRNAKVMQDVKVSALRLIIIPMFTKSLLANETSMVDKETLRSIMKDLLMGENSDLSYSESLRIELLHLSTVLIRFVGQDMMDHRKELIKFAWNHLKSDDLASKQWAYVNVCQFIEVYETPPKIILQVFVALLRTFQSESASLGRKALCILTPALPKRLQPRDLVKAVKWTKKIVYEDGHTTSQLIYIWTLITRHPAIFFPFRGSFLHRMIMSLSRLGLPPNCPFSNRRLAIDLAHLIIVWEERRREMMKARSREVNSVRGWCSSVSVMYMSLKHQNSNTKPNSQVRGLKSLSKSLTKKKKKRIRMRMTRWTLTRKSKKSTKTKKKGNNKKRTASTTKKSKKGNSRRRKGAAPT